MRKELYDFLTQFPHGIKAQIARTFLLKVRTLLDNVPEKDRRAHMYDLVNGHYQIITDTEIDNHEVRRTKD